MRLIYLICFLSFTSSCWAQPASVPPTTATRDVVFSPVGLAFTETAQINVANTAANPANGTASSCSGTISFNTATGAAAQTPVKFTVTSGQIFSAPLTAAKLGVVNGSRSEFIGSVQWALLPPPVPPPPPAPAPPTAPCNLSVSLETFDSVTGVTHVYLSNPSNGPVAVVFPVPH
jgi:hypothetical protein